MMKRQVAAMACALALLLVSGCAGIGGQPSRFLSVFQPESAPPEGSQVCLLDPAAYAPSPGDALGTEENGPTVEVPETSFDFGSLTDGSEFVHKFRVRNVGKSVLNIKKVLPG